MIDGTTLGKITSTLSIVIWPCVIPKGPLRRGFGRIEEICFEEDNKGGHTRAFVKEPKWEADCKTKTLEKGSLKRRRLLRVAKRLETAEFIMDDDQYREELISSKAEPRTFGVGSVNWTISIGLPMTRRL